MTFEARSPASGPTEARYEAFYRSRHANELEMHVTLDGVVFRCRVRPSDPYQVMLEDASQEPSDAHGTRLSQAAARAHPWKAMAFEVLDGAFLHDPSLRGFLRRAACGDPTIPLEYGFDAPDEAYALKGEKSPGVRATADFLCLDDARYFVRCTLPVPVETYGEWNVGLWVEVAKGDHDHFKAVWNDDEAYAKVQCAGILANGATRDLRVPIACGVPVELYVRNVKARPCMKAPTTGGLGAFLAQEWRREDFEDYATAIGFL